MPQNNSTPTHVKNILAFNSLKRHNPSSMKILGANWQTTVSMIGGTLGAALTWLSTVSYDQGAIAAVIPVQYKPIVLKVAGIATLILFCWNGIKQKDKNVTGGVIQQTVSGAVADPGTQTMVDQTVKASIASGDTKVTPEQKAAVGASPYSVANDPQLQ